MAKEILTNQKRTSEHQETEEQEKIKLDNLPQKKVKRQG